MSRRIVTTRLQSAKDNDNLDGYFDRVLKYVPADIVAAWITATGLIAAAGNDISDSVLWICFAFGLIITPLWTHNRTRVDGAPPAIMQMIVSTLAFAVWVFALGGPFEKLEFYSPVYGSLSLVAFTLVTGALVPSQ